MEGPTESLGFIISPDEHLGLRVYQPQNPKTIAEIKGVVSSFKGKLGHNSAKFVQLLITEEKPNYPHYPQSDIDASMSAHTHVYQEIADNDPIGLATYAETKIASLTRMVQEAKDEGAARGITDANDLRLRELGKAMVLTHNVLLEISRKYPNEYQLRGKRLDNPR